MQLLDKKVIITKLKHYNILPNTFNFYLFSSIDSTNTFLMNLPVSTKIEICCSEKQTKSKGRFRRKWFSPFGENIYCSIKLKLNKSSIYGLSIVVGFSVLATLRYNHIDKNVKLKWPNDVFWKNKKLCGILIEIQSYKNNSIYVVIGIGLNVNSITTSIKKFENNIFWCSMREITGKIYNRNFILSDLLYYLYIYINIFLKIGFYIFQYLWNGIDYFSNKMVTIFNGNKKISGKSLGINKLGYLIIQDFYGKIHKISSGCASTKSTIK